MPCISLACGISDITSILRFSLIYMFPGFYAFLRSVAFTAAFPCLAALIAAFPCLCYMLCSIAAPSGTSACSVTDAQFMFIFEVVIIRYNKLARDHGIVHMTTTRAYIT